MNNCAPTVEPDTGVQDNTNESAGVDKPCIKALRNAVDAWSTSFGNLLNTLNKAVDDLAGTASNFTTAVTNEILKATESIKAAMIESSNEQTPESNGVTGQ